MERHPKPDQALIAALVASAANAKAQDAPAIMRVLQANGLRRTATMHKRRDQLSADEAANLTRFHISYERALVDSMESFFRIPAETRAAAATFLDNLEKLWGGIKHPAPAQGDGRLVFRRNPELKGTMSAFGYDYFTDRYGAERERQLRLLQFQGLRGSGGEYAYEVLNLADGRRTAQEIRDLVSAVYGTVPLELVVEYLRALESIRVIQAIK